MSLVISLRSETLKLKRTLSIYLCILAAAFGPFMSVLENVKITKYTKFHQPWTEHFLEGQEPMAIVMLPWYTILVCTLMMQIEYRDKTWKQVLTSPQRLFHVFMAKFMTLQGMMLLLLLTYNAMLCVTALITEQVQPTLFDGKLDVAKILARNTQLWILVLGMSALQFWLSLRFRNFIVPVGIGLTGWFMSAMMLFEIKTSLVEYWPYAFPIFSALPDYVGRVVTWQWYSIASAVLFLGIGFAEFRAKKVRS